MVKRERTAKKGQSLVEYGLILSLVSIITISSVNIIGSKVMAAAASAGDQVEAATTAAATATAGWNPSDQGENNGAGGMGMGGLE